MFHLFFLGGGRRKASMNMYWAVNWILDPGHVSATAMHIGSKS